MRNWNSRTTKEEETTTGNQETSDWNHKDVNENSTQNKETIKDGRYMIQWQNKKQSHKTETIHNNTKNKMTTYKIETNGNTNIYENETQR